MCSYKLDCFPYYVFSKRITVPSRFGLQGIFVQMNHSWVKKKEDVLVMLMKKELQKELRLFMDSLIPSSWSCCVSSYIELLVVSTIFACIENVWSRWNTRKYHWFESSLVTLKIRRFSKKIRDECQRQQLLQECGKINDDVGMTTQSRRKSAVKLKKKRSKKSRRRDSTANDDTVVKRPERETRTNTDTNNF